MPRGVKGLLVAITSVIYLFVLTAFFIAQQAVLVAGKVTGSVIDWGPEKPRALGWDQPMGNRVTREFNASPSLVSRTAPPSHPPRSPRSALHGEIA
jgi:hypothetical protein